MPFVNDNFTDTDTTDLSAHTADSGATWTKRGGSALTINSNSLAAAASGESDGYYSSATPATADYEVQASFHSDNSSGVTPAIALRMATGAATGYIVRYGGGTWQLYSVDAGAESGIGSYTGDSLTNGNPRTVVLKAAGSTISVTIDDVERIAVSDSTVTDVGRPGVAEYYADVNPARYVDTWSASDAAASTSIDQWFAQAFPMRDRPSLVMV